MSARMHSDEIHLQENNNNTKHFKKMENDKSDEPCFLEKLANHICRNYNWIIVLMLTPISLSYDFYCFGR